MWVVLVVVCATIYFMGVAVSIIVGFMEWDRTTWEDERKSAAALVFQSPIWPFTVLKLFIETLQDMWREK